MSNAMNNAKSKTTSKNGWLRKAAGICIAGPLNSMGASRNQVGTMRLLIGIAAALALAAGPAWFSVAAALFLAGFLLARSDATLARVAGEASPASERYLFFGDMISNSLAFFGLGIGLQGSAAVLQTSEYGFPAPVVMGLIAAVAVAAVPWLAKRLEIIDGRRSPEFDGVAGFDGDDMALMVPIALWIGWAEGLLVLAALGGATFAGGLYMAHFRKFHSLT